MSRGYPSMTALLGLLAIAGYQNRDKLSEMLSGLGRGGTASGAQGGLGGLLGQLGGSGVKQLRGGILFDMVGNRSLKITLPADSPAEMARDVFASAEALKLRSHFTYLDREMIDDHMPLNEIGIPTIDVIDFSFPWWHTAEDTMDKLSAQSLQIVGSVAAYYLSEFALK